MSTSEAQQGRDLDSARAGAGVDVSTHLAKPAAQLGPALDLSRKKDCPF
jgi:hypothetical protein